jgi:hypothetical protein
VEEVLRHEENAIMADFFDQREVAERVVQALQDHHAHDGLRTKAREHVVRHYDLAKVCLPAQLALLHRLAAAAAAAV